MSNLYQGTDSVNKLSATSVFPYTDTIEMYGYGGNDELQGAFLNPNIIYGGSGDDTISGGAKNDKLFGDDGNDVINCWQADYSELFGGNGNDLLTGGNRGNLLDGGTGNDTLIGGDGADTYVVDSVLDQIQETYVPYYDNDPNPRDLVQARISWTLGDNVEDLTLVGNTAINGTGNSLNNVLRGNAAANILNGSSGADTMSGFGGNDTYIVDSSKDVVIEVTGSGTDKVQSSVSYTLTSNVEYLELTGNSAINGSGNDLNNIINGNSAGNILNGNSGADTMYGGAGSDTYIVDNSGDVVIEYASSGSDKVQSSVTYTLSSNVEYLVLTGSNTINGTGNDLANILRGNGAMNTLNGGAGADTMYGGTGSDTYIVDSSGDVVVEYATSGSDKVQSSVSYTLTSNVEYLVLTGSSAINGVGNSLNNIIKGNGAANILKGDAGADTIYGGTGNDTIVGGSGADKMTGDSGSDTFKFSLLSEMGLGNSADTITDFVHGTDKIDLSAIDPSSSAGDQAFTYLSSLSGVTNYTNTVYFDSSTHTLNISTDADAAAEYQIHLTGVSNLNTADLIL